MLSEKKESNYENNELNNSINDIHNQQNINGMRRGFDVFLNYGLSPIELRTLRFIFHLSILRNNIHNFNRPIDFSLQAMYEREEEWLRNQMENNTRNNQINQFRNQRNDIHLLVYNNNNNLYGIRARRYFRNNNSEPNINFLRGFFFGLVLNVFSIILIACFRLRPKFKIGVLFGMMLSICIAFPFMMIHNMRC